MNVYNTMTRTVEPFVPIEAGRVRMYTCGPTVYNYAHIGNFRAYMFEDILRRQLKACGLAVTQVMNLTDVDDKTIRGAREGGMALQAFTATFKQAFFEDLQALRIEPAEHYPAATDYVPDMIALIERLIASGHAYHSDDGSVYYRVNTFAAYGCLAHLQLDGLKAEARVRQDEYEKEHVGDFALWKAWDHADGDVAWDSPWGRGRPGWHIECSAMSMRLLGESFDIHTGGVDNIFPHHENEIAQSEGATGQHPFVRYWMHCGYLVVDGAKMSKSLGNYLTLRDLLTAGYRGREVRYVLLASHYRQSLNFSLTALDAARAALARLDECRARLEAQAAGGPAGAPVAPLPAWAEAAGATFRAAMADDLNTPEALAALFHLVNESHRALDQGAVSAPQAAAVLALWQSIDAVLGVLEPEIVTPDAETLALAEARTAARARRDWAEADRLRDALAANGWDVRDTPEGPKLKPRRP